MQVLIPPLMAEETVPPQNPPPPPMVSASSQFLCVSQIDSICITDFILGTVFGGLLQNFP